MNSYFNYISIKTNTDKSNIKIHFPLLYLWIINEINEFVKSYSFNQFKTIEPIFILIMISYLYEKNYSHCLYYF